MTQTWPWCQGRSMITKMIVLIIDNADDHNDDGDVILQTFEATSLTESWGRTWHLTFVNHCLCHRAPNQVNCHLLLNLDHLDGAEITRSIGKSWGNTKGPTIPDHKRPDEAGAQTISSRIHHSIVSPLSGKEKHTKYDSRRYGCSLRDLTYWQGHKHRMWQSSWGRLLQGGWACGVSHHSIEQTNLNHLWYLDHRHLQIQNFDSLILFNIGWFWERDTPVCRPL